MATWETEIFRGELAQTVKSEYRKLLSVNKTGEEAEYLVVHSFLSDIAPGSKEEGRMWLALALREWQLGRLTQNAWDKAQQWAAYPWEEISSNAIQTLLSTLDSPMPESKKIRPPSYVSHCPWPVGSLLAYRIISSDHPHVTQSPFYGKYVLLRIVMIKRHPITWLAPDAGWNESMLVGLYDWIGDAKPDPKIAESLSFTPVSIQELSLPSSAFQHLKTDKQPAWFSDTLQQVIQNTTSARIETCSSLDWRCIRGIRRDEVFTYLGCDPSFQQDISPFFKTNATDYALCHSVPFDAVLVNRFKQLAAEVTDDSIV